MSGIFSAESTVGWQVVTLAVGAALPVLLLGWWATPAFAGIEPECLVLAILLVGLLYGLRGVLLLLPTCWFLLSAGWLLENRLALALDGGDFIVTGEICSVPRNADGIQRFVFELDNEWVAQGFVRRTYLSWYDATEIVRAGETWRLLLRLKRPRGTSNPAGFDVERWAFLNDYGATGYIRQSTVNRRISHAARRCQLSSVRQDLADRLIAILPDATAPDYLPALLVGIRDGLDQADWRVLQATGTAHLMAISGLHIGLAAGFGLVLFRWLGRALILAGLTVRLYPVPQVAALAAALGYSLLAGFALPTLRAFVMTWVIILFSAFHRQVPPVSALAVALYVVLWIEPFAMLTAGFWMSFGAVGLLLLSGFGLDCRVAPIPGEPAGRRPMWQRFVQLCRAQGFLAAGLLPVTAIVFAILPIFAPLINFLVVPVFSLIIIPLLLLSVLAIYLVPSMATAALVPADWLLGQVIAMLFWVSETLPVAFTVPALPWAIAVATCLLPWSLLWPAPLPGRLVIVAAATALIVTISVVKLIREPQLRIVVIDVGQGLSVLIQSPGYAALYDAGPRYRSGDAGRSIVVPVLRYFGVAHLDQLIVSHPDADHAGGVRSVLAAFPGAHVLVSDRSRHQQADLCTAGQVWQQGRTELRILHPDADQDISGWSRNDASCVLQIRHGRHVFLLPGDLERRGERRLSARLIQQRFSMVIAPHHGSRTSSTPEFIASVPTQFIAFSVGHRNRWNFPDPQVVRRWQEQGACILNTARDGALVFEIERDGNLGPVRLWRSTGARIWSETLSLNDNPVACNGRLL